MREERVFGAFGAEGVLEVRGPFGEFDLGEFLFLVGVVGEFGLDVGGERGGGAGGGDGGGRGVATVGLEEFFGGEVFEVRDGFFGEDGLEKVGEVGGD